MALVIACVGGPVGALSAEAVRGRLTDAVGAALVGAASVFFLAAAYWLVRDTHGRGR